MITTTRKMISHFKARKWSYTSTELCEMELKNIVNDGFQVNSYEQNDDLYYEVNIGGRRISLNCLLLNKLTLNGDKIQEMQPYIVNYEDANKSVFCYSFVYSDGRFYPSGNGPLDNELPILDITDDIYLRDNNNQFNVIKVKPLL